MPLRRALRRFATLIALALAALLLPAGSASAHADLLSATPADGAVLTAVPPQVTLRFSEQITLRLSSLKMIGPDGRRIDRGAPHSPDGTSLTVALAPDDHPGTFVLDWLVTAADDGHATSGALLFSVGAPGRPAVTGPFTPHNRLTDAVLDAAVWLGLAGLALLIGTTAVRRCCLPPRHAVAPGRPAPGRTGPGATGYGATAHVAACRPDLRRPAALGWGAVLAGALVQLFVHGPATQGLSLAHVADRSLLAATLATHEGYALSARILLLAVVAAFGEPLLRPAWGPPAAAAPALALAATWSATSHATTGPLVPLALAATTLHVACMALWAGGLYAVLSLLRSGGDDAELTAATARFSLLALAAVTVLAVTGLYQALREAGSPAQLADTPYGRLLLLKTGLVVLVLAVAARSATARRRSATALRRSVLLELLGVTAVLVVTILLIGTAPARGA
ncbi:copper resistance protein CopC [Kitasatospora sp. NPDC002227]|uniref:copper resistance CopC/CopD family protein n=1 Tax=Kitasatospora sp. NPDC002227 TaxID=3154773 RepID=UPI0033241BAB